MSIPWKSLVSTCLVFLVIGSVSSCERRKAELSGREIALRRASHEMGLSSSDIEKIYRIVSDSGTVSGVEEFDFYLRSIWTSDDVGELLSDESKRPMFFTVSINIEKGEVVDFRFLEDTIGQGVGMDD